MDHFSFWIKIPFPFWKFYWNIFWIFFLCFLLFCRNTDYIWKKLLCLFFINIIFLSYNNELLVFIYFCLLLPSYPPLSVLCFHMTLWGVCVFVHGLQRGPHYCNAFTFSFSSFLSFDQLYFLLSFYHIFHKLLYICFGLFEFLKWFWIYCSKFCHDFPVNIF